MLKPPPLSEQHRSTIEDFATSDAWQELRLLMEAQFANDWMASATLEAREAAHQRQQGLWLVDVEFKKYAAIKAKRDSDNQLAAAEDAQRRSNSR